MKKRGRKVGFKHSESAKKKMSITAIGRKHSSKTRKKISETRKGIRFSEEHIKNIKIARLAWLNKNGIKPRANDKGYILIYSPEHPNRTKKNHVFEHRLVMEKKIGRFLKKDEQVHHRNGIKNDNRIENLAIVLRPHYGRIDCPYCNKNFLIK